MAMPDQERLSEQAITIFICPECGRIEGEQPQAGCCPGCGIASDPFPLEVVAARQLTEAEHRIKLLTLDIENEHRIETRYREALERIAGFWKPHSGINDVLDSIADIANEALDTADSPASPPKSSSGEALDTGGSEG